MSRIFISYRRADSRDATERIHDRLVQVFGKNSVFLDVDNNIPIGSSFPQVLTETLQKCDVVLVIIGDKWLDIRDEENPALRRIDNPKDFVRLEIETALSNPEIKTIPVLFDKADMPAEKDLDNSLQKLVEKQAAKVRRNPDFHDDMENLIQVIKQELSRKDKILEDLRKKEEKRKQDERERRALQQKQKEEEAAQINAEKEAEAAQINAEKEAQLLQEQLRNKEFINTRVSELLNISEQNLELNKLKKLGSEQVKYIRRQRHEQLSTSIIYLVTYIIFMGYILSFLEDKSSTTTCLGIIVFFALPLIWRFLTQLWAWIKPPIKIVEGEMFNVHLKQGKLSFDVNKVSIETSAPIDSLQNLREFENYPTTVFYHEGTGVNFLLSLEVRPPSP